MYSLVPEKIIRLVYEPFYLAINFSTEPKKYHESTKLRKHEKYIYGFLAQPVSPKRGFIPL